MRIALLALAARHELMAVRTERREVFDAIEVPRSNRRIAAMMRLKRVRGIAQPAGVTVAGKRLDSEQFPLCRRDIRVVSHDGFKVMV